MSYVEVCQKHGQHHGEICSECFEDLKEENVHLREALNIITQDYKIVPRDWQDQYSGTGEKQPTKAALIARAALDQLKKTEITDD